MPDLQTYGCPDKFKRQFDYNRWAFAHPNQAVETPSRQELFKAIAEELLPGYFEWHLWTERLVDAICNNRWVGLSGCSNSAKSFNTASFACLWWLCAPEESSVLLISTTMKMLRRRAWSFVGRVHREIGGETGFMMDSFTLWKHARGDDLHGIFGVAVEEGDINRTTANIQGLHTRRQLILVDEAPGVGSAIWKAAANLYSYPIDCGGEFIFVAAGNTRSRIDSFGKFIEPMNGWNSVSIEDESWESKPQLDGTPAKVLRFDFRKSPNIVAGKTVSRHLPSAKRVADRMAALKAKNAENDPEHWAYDLGFPPPEGAMQTVFTETLLSMHNAGDRHTFTGTNFTIIGAFDPAFGGDRPALRFAAMGDIGEGILGIESMPAIVLYLDSKASEPIRYQLVRQLKEHCNAVRYRGEIYKCEPRNLGIDCTGDGGVADIAAQTWSNEFLRIQFGGGTSTEPCSHEDQRPAKEVWKNKRCEMYHRSRNAVSSGQLKGIDQDTAAELVQIKWKWSGSLIVLEDKDEYRAQHGKSCDLGDSEVMLLEVAYKRGFRIAAVGLTVNFQDPVVDIAAKAQEVYEQPGYQADYAYSYDDEA